ncbi:MAG: protease modulator HflC [Verrucomicrobiota bacterium]
MNRNIVILVIGLVLMAIFGLLLFTFQVRTTEVVVVTTFGKPTREITHTAGRLYLKWPQPIQKVYRFDNRVQTLDPDRFTEDLTSDNINLMTMVYVGWSIITPTNFFPRFGDSVADAEKNLEGMVRSAKAAVVGRHPLSDFVSASGDGSKFVAIENEILQMVQSQVQTNNYGIAIHYLGIKRLGLPPAVTESVFERMTSDRQYLVSLSRNEGEAEAQKIRSSADRKAAEILAAAEGQATQIRGKGEAEASKSLAVFQQNPQLARFLFSLTALENSLKERSTLIFDQQTMPFDLFRAAGTNQITK